MFVGWSLPILFSYQLRHNALETGIILHGKKSSWWDFIKAKWSAQKGGPRCNGGPMEKMEWCWLAMGSDVWAGQPLIRSFIVSLFNFRFWGVTQDCDPRSHMWHGSLGFLCHITESFRRDVGDFLRCLVCTYPMQVKEQVEISAVYNLLDVAQCCYQLVGGFQCFSWFQSGWHVYLHLLGVEDVRTLTHVCQMGWSRQFFLLHVFSKSLNLMKLHSWIQLPMAFQSKGLRLCKRESKSYSGKRNL